MNLNCSCGKELCTSKISLFSNLPGSIQRKIASKAVHTERGKGEYIINEGDSITSIKIIREGRVKINSYDIEGKEYILDILSNGDTIGEDLLFETENFKYNAICITDVKLCDVNKKDLLDIVSEEPEIAWNIIKHLSSKLHKTNNLLEILQKNDATARIAQFLLERSERIVDEEINLTIDDVAASVNLRKETVSRKLSELQDKNYIKRLGQKRIKILDTDGLKKLV